MEAIANLKKRFVIQVVVVWKPCAECPGDAWLYLEQMLGKKLTYLLTYRLSQSEKEAK